MNIYLVERVAARGSPQTTFAIFATQEDAWAFADTLKPITGHDTIVVVARTLWHGQPPHRGFNK